ncbi:protein FAM180A [Nothobranchius furzeri]|uniref:Protein FAM180A-like n=1 Tax=Nothobranchius furzeri TaxID=105023 RepID=A0A9D3BZ10_NOTFU|nr:protein FAM180A [Nothobranchius furzeri]KAF7224334.1 protein FAM180A-like [Nothobranchius furzeri]
MNSHLKLWLLILSWLWFDRVLRDAAAGIHPTSETASALSDANLMFEFLLGGVATDQDNIFLLDEEMSSMRKGKEFLSHINDGIPKTPNAMELMVHTLQNHPKKHLTQDQFESLILSMVYSAHQAQVQGSKEKQEAWGGVLLQLANITVFELRGSFLVNT